MQEIICYYCNIANRTKDEKYVHLQNMFDGEQSTWKCKFQMTDLD